MRTMKLFCATALLLGSATANAQVPETGRNEYSLYLTGAVTNLVYNLHDGGTKRFGFGYGGGFAYSRNFRESWSASAGIEIQTFSAKASFASVGETYKAIDNLGQMFDYSYSLNGYDETQTVVMLALPLRAQYKIEIGRNMHFYVAPGIKLGFPVSADALISTENLTSEGYYEAEMITYRDLPQHGFFDGSKPNDRETKIKTGFAVMLSLESGIRFALGGKTAMYAGLYFDYAPNNMKQTDNKHLVEFNRNISRESVLSTGFADRLNLMSAGMKVRFSLF